MKKSESQNKKINKKDTKQVQANKKIKKLSNSERAQFDDMNQIEWFPVDPYCD